MATSARQRRHLGVLASSQMRLSDRPAARARAALVAAALVVGVACVVGDPAAAGTTAGLRTLRSPTQHVVAFEPPAGWERAATPPSSRLLATWAHHDGGRLTLVAELAAGKTALQIFEQSRPALEKQGWSLGKTERKPERVILEATLDKGRRHARQLYLVEDGWAYVVTMAAPAEQDAARAHDFDEAIGSLKLGTGEDGRK